MKSDVCANCERRRGDDTHGPKGSILPIAFDLDGQMFTALNCAPILSLLKPSRSPCGATCSRKWVNIVQALRRKQRVPLKDKFGLSCQVVPACLPDLIKHPTTIQAMR